MANPTNPFSWQMPTASDLVTDLPADFEVFGQAVATSMADLLGGTSGQVLSKASNTDMDFTWVTTDDANAIQNSIVDAKGDLIAATANDTPARLAVGANDLLLTAASGEATGLKYTGAWTSYTPTFTGLTVGNGTLTANYNKIGKVMFMRVSLNFGSTTAITGSVSMSMPGSGQPGVYTTTNAIYEDAGVGFYVGNIVIFGATAYLGSIRSSTTFAQHEGLNATNPFTWTTNDGIFINASYEVA